MPIKFQKDKLMHYIASMVITLGSCLAIGPAGVGVGIGAGVGKELYDKKQGKEFSRADLFADNSGVVVGFVVYALIWMLQQG